MLGLCLCVAFIVLKPCVNTSRLYSIKGGGGQIDPSPPRVSWFSSTPGRIWLSYINTYCCYILLYLLLLYTPVLTAVLYSCTYCCYILLAFCAFWNKLFLVVIVAVEFIVSENVKISLHESRWLCETVTWCSLYRTDRKHLI